LSRPAGNDVAKSRLCRDLFPYFAAIMYFKPQGASASDSGADGASVSEAGAPDLLEKLEPVHRREVERAFRAWMANNDQALSIGGTGDLVELVFALKAAIAKS